MNSSRSGVFLICAVVLPFFLSNCKKSQTDRSSTQLQTEISLAQRYFDSAIVRSTKTFDSSNYRANQPKVVDWNSAKSIELSVGKAVVAPIQFKNNLYLTADFSGNRIFSLSNISNLIIFRDSIGVYRYELVTYIPDSVAVASGVWQSGIVLYEDWQGNSLGRPSRLNPISIDNGTPSGDKESDVTQSIQVCNTVYGYNYSVDDPDDGESWSEETCNTYGFSQNTTGPGLIPRDLAGISAIRPILPERVQIAPPTSPITNIASYFQCFTNGTLPDHTYSVTVCVDQPDPGTRDPWGLTPGGVSGSSAAANGVNTGHVFLVLSENNQGNIITRNVGFYPSGLVSPSPASMNSSQGVLNDDESHQYNLSLNINVTSTQFFGILNSVSLGNNPGYFYNINSNNCTTFVLNALGANGISLPATKGTWAGGTGDDPGDLGEDLVQMSLTENMALNTVSNPHPNTGSCN